MKYIQLKIAIFFKKNLEISLLFLLLALSVFITQLYNYNAKKTQEDTLKILKNSYFENSLSYLLANLNPRYEDFEHVVKNNESIVSILNDLSVDNNDIKKITTIFNKNNLQIQENFKINITIDNAGKNKKILELIIPVSKTKEIKISRDIKKNTFDKNEVITNLKKLIVLKEGTIKSSLYKSATKLNMSSGVIVEFARLYGFQVDFQRDIRKNDSYQIIYESLVDENGKEFKSGKILYANLVLRGQSNQLYFYPNKKYTGHYDENGKSIKKALMKTPINGARLSSSFGMRKHPILGFNKMHKGTDFAAPEGTPIMASGDGTIIKAGWCGGGGNCVKIKHNTTYQTVYAHMKNFSNLAIPGSRVKQGQIIGYVGSTGMSTGPHLHYEVIENGSKINSQKLKLPPGRSLEGNNRKQFEIVRIKTDVLKSDLIVKSF